ncbi:MAG: hypothetical protein PHW56_09205 [Methanosarcinaceae archaeon]|nr:hypothetical protein [Methanosarcinaceae archaeon]
MNAIGANFYPRVYVAVFEIPAYKKSEVSGGQALFKNCYDSIKKELVEAGEA